MTNKQPKIEIAHLAKSFGNKTVLRDVSLSIPAGQSLCIIGTSGCGKSVTLKCLLGLITPDEGSIKIDGVETVGQSRGKREEVLRRFGMTFQFGALFDSLPIWKNITFRLKQSQSLSRQQARDIAAEIVVQLGLEARVIDQYPAELSGGMQKRVALARAIADKPEILLFDEPTSALDPELQQEVVKAIKDLAAEHRTMILVTHDMRLAADVSDHVVFLHQGRIEEEGPPGQVFGAPKTDRLRQFLSATMVA